jgi:hypothetical protein
MFQQLTSSELRTLDIKLRHAGEQLSHAAGRTAWERSADAAATEVWQLRGDISAERTAR